jgi:hypothetical protein
LRPSSPLLLLAAIPALSAPAPSLPGRDVRELDRSWGDTIVAIHRPQSTPASGGIGSWQAKTPSEQLRDDATVLGVGEGAVFVPTMTHGRLEPRVTVRDGNGEIAVLGMTGRRIRLPPGAYSVEVGSGSDDQRISVPVEVREGRTEVTPVPWAGLTITTIDPNRQPIRGEYKLVRQDRFQAYGEGFGQDEDRLSDLPTWILPPGVYKLTGLAAGTDDLTNFVTVRLLAGEWIEYTLVMEEERVVGGGMLPQVATNNQREQWRFGADIGGSVAWTREKQSRQENLLTTTNLTGYTQLRARREAGPWLTSARLQFVGGGAKVSQDSWRVTPDEITAQLFAVRRVTPRIGPYARLVGASHVFPTVLDLSGSGAPLRAYERDRNTGTVSRITDAGETYEAAGPFAPLELRQGLGLNVEALQHPLLEISIQGGIASRQVFPLGAKYQKALQNPALLAQVRGVDSTSTPTNSVVLEQAVYEHGTGLEATGDLRLRLGSSASLVATPGAFWGLWPREQTEYSLTSVVSLHLTRFLSTDYRFAIKRSLEEGAIHRYPYTHQVLLRFSFGA